MKTTKHPMTLRAIIEALETIPEDQRGLPLYVFDFTNAFHGDNIPVESLSLYDSDEPHSPDNPLAVNIHATEKEEEG